MKNIEMYFNEDEINNKLLISTIFLNVFEIFKQTFVSRYFGFMKDIQDFKDVDEYLKSKKQSHMFYLDKAYDWYLECGALTEADITLFKNLKNIRNECGHNGLSILLGGPDLNLIENLNLLINLFEKTELWCIRNILMASDPIYDNQEIADENIHSPILEYVKYLSNIVLKNQ